MDGVNPRSCQLEHFPFTTRGYISVAGERVLQTDTHVVGVVQLGMFFEIKASGPTWEAAFRVVDEKDAREHDFYESLDQPCPECCATMRYRTNKGPGLHKHTPTWSPSLKKHVCAVCVAREKAAAPSLTPSGG